MLRSLRWLLVLLSVSTGAMSRAAIIGADFVR